MGIEGRQMSDCSADIRRRQARNFVNVGRVEVFPDAKADKEQGRKILEEAAEVFGAWQRYAADVETGDAMGYPRHARVTGSFDDLADELADVVMACMNMARGMGIVDFSARREECAKRNRARGRM